MTLSSRVTILCVAALLLFVACSETFSKPDIKDEFCGVHINYQYCKCAFHDDYCDSLGLTQGAARTHVYAEYDVWVEELFSQWKTLCGASGGFVEGEKCVHEYGVVERQGNLYLNAPPGETISIETNDLPVWARGTIATAGSLIATSGTPDVVESGDNRVLLDGKPVARINDTTVQGGVIVEGSDRIFVNGKPVATIGSMAVTPMVTGGNVPNVGGPIVN